jgi:hypothetical protein
MIVEKKVFTNLYWSKTKRDLVAMGMYGNESAADKKVLSDDEVLIFQGTIPATLQFEFTKEIKVNKE